MKKKKKSGKSSMNKKTLEQIKKKLLELRARIVDGLEHIEKDTLNLSQRDSSGDLSGYSFHMADVATDNYDREFNLDRASSEQQLLNFIDEALEKIEEGTYGVCEGCDHKIKVKRLQALPFAKLCIKCKEKEEKGKKKA